MLIILSPNNHILWQENENELISSGVFATWFLTFALVKRIGNIKIGIFKIVWIRRHWEIKWKLCFKWNLKIQGEVEKSFESKKLIRV